jgi:hypothetical protein
MHSETKGTHAGVNESARRALSTTTCSTMTRLVQKIKLHRRHSRAPEHFLRLKKSQRLHFFQLPPCEHLFARAGKNVFKLICVNISRKTIHEL